jgi:hypothetical protein
MFAAATDFKNHAAHLRQRMYAGATGFASRRVHDHGNDR